MREIKRRLFYFVSCLFVVMGLSITFGYSIACARYVGLEKYRELDRVLIQISAHEYDEEEYNCLNFSEDAKMALEGIGIRSSVIRVHEPGRDYDHAIVGVWIEPQSAELVEGAWIEEKGIIK